MTMSNEELRRLMGESEEIPEDGPDGLSPWRSDVEPPPAGHERYRRWLQENLRWEVRTELDRLARRRGELNARETWKLIEAIDRLICLRLDEALRWRAKRRQSA